MTCMFPHTRLILCFVCTVLRVLFCIYLPYMVKKWVYNVLFHFLLCRKTPYLQLISSASSDFCLARLKYLVQLLVSPSYILTFSIFFPLFLPILLLLLLLFFFPFASPTSLLLSPSPPSKNPGRNKINASHFGGASGPASVFKKFFQKTGGLGGPYPPVLKEAVCPGF